MYQGSVDQPTNLRTYSMYTVQCIDHVCTRVQLTEVCSAMHYAVFMDQVCTRVQLTEVCTYTCVFSAMYCSEWLVVVNPVLSCIS